MARYRIVARPAAVGSLEESVYDVEESLGMALPDGRLEGIYWSFVETFYSLEDAEQYAEALVSRRQVVKEYN
jgi:hypothetical protein